MMVIASYVTNPALVLAERGRRSRQYYGIAGPRRRRLRIVAATQHLSTRTHTPDSYRIWETFAKRRSAQLHGGRRRALGLTQARPQRIHAP